LRTLRRFIAQRHSERIWARIEEEFPARAARKKSFALSYEKAAKGLLFSCSFKSHGRAAIHLRRREGKVFLLLLLKRKEDSSLPDRPQRREDYETFA
jgi:hypothetical protein